MTRRYRTIDFIASVFSKFLVERPVMYDRLNDDDYITILSWCEDWEPEKVYDTAYKQSQLPYVQTWEQWSTNMKPLPDPVRYYLKCGLKKHEEQGNLKALRAYAFFYEQIIEKWGKRFLWASLLFLIYYLFF